MEGVAMLSKLLWGIGYVVVIVLLVLFIEWEEKR